MSRLTDYELDTLLKDVGQADKRLRPLNRDYEDMLPRFTRLLEEQRELRDQAAEASHMAALEEET
jgi:hypothetical protein